MIRSALAALAVLLLPPFAAAQTATVYEGFDYQAGSPPNLWNGGTGWSPNTPSWNFPPGPGAWGVVPPPLSFSNASGTLVTSGLALDTVFTPDTGTRLNRSFATDLASSNGGDWWMSFLINKTQAGTGDYGGITIGNGGGSTADVGRLFIGDGGGNNLWRLERAGGGNAGLSNHTATVGQTTLLVVRLQINNAGYDTATLYVNPTTLDGGPPASPDAFLPVLDFNPGGIPVSLVNIDYGAGAYTFDEIRVGTTFASVTPVPEPAGVLLAATATLLLRRGLRR